MSDHDTRDDDLFDAAVRKLHAGEQLTKQEANAYFAAGLFNPINQVYFRAGLIACREYMARFVEAQSPEIAGSIRANWWPKLGPDFGPPRLMDWNELAEGNPGESNFKVKEPISPTLEALPIALQFLQTPEPAPLACTRSGGARAVDRPNDPHDDLTPGADPTDRAGVAPAGAPSIDEKCDACGGKGLDPACREETCIVCGGSGVVPDGEIASAFGNAPIKVVKDCPKCKGKAGLKGPDA